jgi:uncharacterized protein
MYYPRHIEASLKRNLKNNVAVIITGMRRVGKTTLLREICNTIPANSVWFDFENPLDIKQFEDIDYNDIYQNIIRHGNLDPQKRIYVFIDEVQLFPEISKIVKYLIDHYRVKFFLTGSASYYLKNLFPESLAGRKIIFELFPLDFEEFLIFKGEDAKRYNAIRSKNKHTRIEYEIYDVYYREFMEWGGFPEVVLASQNTEKRNRLEEIFSSYYQKEILNLADYRKGYKVRDLLVLLAVRVGSQLDIVKLSQELQITRATLYSYLAFLKDTYFIHLVSRFSQSRDREVSGTQKVYICDTGILNIMAQVNRGQILENAVFNQLHHKGRLHYFRKKTGAEIDFILNKKTAYEVKHTASPTDIRALQRAMQSVKIKTGHVVSKQFVDTQSTAVRFAEFL